MPGRLSGCEQIINQKDEDMTAHQEYLKKSTAQVAAFAESLKENATNKTNGTFDSAAAQDFISSAVNQNTGLVIPEKVQVVLDELSEDAGNTVLKAVLDGIAIYEKQHGCKAPADVVEQALHSAYATTDMARIKNGLPKPMALDSVADSNHSEPTSLQPNRAVVAILSALGDAIPVAHYLPADISSNEGKLAIMSHRAGNTIGSYTENDSLDGTSSGNHYITGKRIHKMTPATSTGNITGKLTKVQDTELTCDQAGDAIKLLRGRAILYVNGRAAAREVANNPGSGNNSMTGTITLGATEYTIGGTINTDTGAFAITTSPAMPDTTPVAVESVIDFERDSSLTPMIQSAVNTFTLYANPWRAYTQNTIDTRTQMANELGLDPYSESVIAIQTQFANERHYEVLNYAWMLAANNSETFDFDWSSRSTQLTKTNIMMDLFSVIGALSQQMAEDTKDHGVTHLYVGKNMASLLMSLGRDIFQSSGLSPRPSIYRLGRLLGLWDVYYTPKVVTEAANSANILCIGRGTSVPLNPFVLGDAVPPTVVPLAVNVDLKQGAGFYARNFTAVNPFDLAANGCALLQVTNMPTNV